MAGRLHLSAGLPSPLTLEEGSLPFARTVWICAGKQRPSTASLVLHPLLFILLACHEAPASWVKTHLNVFSSYGRTALPQKKTVLNAAGLQSPSVTLTAPAETSCKCAECRLVLQHLSETASSAFISLMRLVRYIELFRQNRQVYY